MKGRWHHLLEMVIAKGLEDLTDEEWQVIVEGKLSDIAPADRGEQLWHLSGHLASARQRLQLLEGVVADLRRQDVIERGSTRYADTYITVAPKTTRTVHVDSLLGWLEAVGEALDLTTSELIDTVFRLNGRNLRITNLRQLAERAAEANNVEDVDGYVAAIEDTFTYTKREPEGTLVEIPIDKAPKWVATLEHGHRVGSYRNQEVDDDGADSDSEQGGEAAGGTDP